MDWAIPDGLIFYETPPRYVHMKQKYYPASVSTLLSSKVTDGFAALHDLMHESLYVLFALSHA